jgi:hypothetical protein
VGDLDVELASPGPALVPRACPHFLQKLWVGALAVPQLAQTAPNFAPHSGQKSASEGVSCWHRGHFMTTLPRAGRGSGPTIARGAGAGQITGGAHGSVISPNGSFPPPPSPASTSCPCRGTSSSRWRGAPGPARACPCGGRACRGRGGSGRRGGACRARRRGPALRRGGFHRSSAPGVNATSPASRGRVGLASLPRAPSRRMSASASRARLAASSIRPAER